MDFSAFQDWPSKWVKTTKGFPSCSGWTRTEAHDLSILLLYTPFMLSGVVPGNSGARATYAAASGVSCSASGAVFFGVDFPCSNPFAGTSSDFASAGLRTGTLLRGAEEVGRPIRGP